MPIEKIKTTESWSTRKTKAVLRLIVIQETHDVKTFQFKAEPEQLFHFKPGQFIGIQLEINGEKHNRSYTIASSPTRPHILELTIKFDPKGAVSPWLHENIKVGSELDLRGPAGRFNNIDIESDKVLLISAGSGITPMMSMTRFWADLVEPKDIQFLNWSRSVQDIIFRRELSLLDYNHDNLNVEIVCTQPGLSENWLGRRGRVNKNLLLDVAPDLLERTVFCCGPDGFMEQVKNCLAEAGFDMANYHDETFDPGGKKKAKLLEQKQAIEEAQIIEASTKETASTFQLTFQKTGKTVDISSNENLLEKIEASGISIESACRVGNCGSCVVKKISGETETENTAGLSSELKESGHILTCTTKAKSNVILDL